MVEISYATAEPQILCLEHEGIGAWRHHDGPGRAP